MVLSQDLVTRARQRPQEARTPESCLRDIVQCNPDAVMIVDQDGLVRFVNQAAERLYGRCAEELLCREFGFPVAVGETAKLSIPRQDGTTVTAEMRVTEIQWEGDTSYLASIRDTTERSTDEEALSIRTRHLETVSKVTNLLLRRRSFTEKCTDVLEELRRVVPADLATFRVLEEDQLRLVAAAGHPSHLPPMNLISLRSHSGSAFQSGEPMVATDCPTYSLSKSTILEEGIKSEASLPITVEGRTLGVINVLSREVNHFSPDRIKLLAAIGDGLGAQLENAKLYDEISSELKQRQRVEQALGASEARFRELYDEAPVGYHEVDVSGRLIRVNRTELGMLGYAAEELLGRPIWEFMVDPDSARQTFADEVDGIISTSGAYERTFLLKDRTTLPALIEDRAIHNAAGRIIGFRSTIQDITERKRTEERLMEAGRLASIGELAAGVAHEINNPLTIVAGFAEVLMSKPLESPASDHVQLIYEESQRVARIVTNLLSFARKHEPYKEYACVTTVLEEALEIKSHDLEVNNIRVTCEWPVDLSFTMVDVHQLLQVLVNVLANAEHALTETHGGGEIILRAVATEDKIQISIRDNGPGIPPDHLHKIFDPFFTTKGPREGTGLGLSICHGIIRQHSGEIWAESQLGAGTTFHIELPILSCAEEDNNSVEEPIVDAPGHKQWILVVDDEPAIRDLMCQVLTSDGHTADQPADSREAVDMIRNHRYDCIIMDLRMPDISGQQLYQIVADTNPALARKVIFMTGDTVRRETREFLEATGNPVFSKPINTGDLRRQIQELAEQQGLRNCDLGLSKPKSIFAIAFGEQHS